MTAAAAARVLRQSPNSLSPRHGPIFSEGDTYYHWWEVTRPPTFLYPQGSECLLIYAAATHPCTRGAPPRSHVI
ncbi:hypothetical protein AVEN_260013-1, partial [Araneus ventricosus]